MSNNKQEQSGEKKMTSYDRKVEARKQKEVQEKKNHVRNRILIAAAALVIVGAVLYTSLSSVFEKRAALNDTYIKVGNHEVTKVEYDYHYSNASGNFLTANSYLLPYIGLDVEKDFAEQQYSEDMTWKDAFDQMTVDQIKQIKAWNDDAAAAGFEYDPAEDYAKVLADIKNASEEAGIDVKTYYQAMYGEYATESNMEGYIKEALLASAYAKHLEEQNRPSDEEVAKQYDENKNDYDQVSYYVAQFDADVETAEDEEEPDEAAVKAAMDEQKKSAEAMLERLEAGEDFETLAEEYLPAVKSDSEDENEEENSEEETKDAHLKEKFGYNSVIGEGNQEWLFETARKAGDCTVIEDTENDRYFVLKFVERVRPEDTDERIIKNLSEKAVSDHLAGLLESGYEVTDVKGDLVYLTIPQDETDEEETEDAE